jgi:uncharacterized protein
MLGYRRMPVKVAQKAIDLLFDYSCEDRNLVITHFGGEPMLNFDAVIASSEYATRKAILAKKSVRFRITTNGTLLTDAMAKQLAKHKIRVLLSVDGLQESHDRYRFDKLGRGTFPEVLRTILLLRSNKQSVGARVTVMPDNLPRMYDDVIGLHSLGISSFVIGPATGIPWSQEEMQHYCEQLARLKVWYDANSQKGGLYIDEFAKQLQKGVYGCPAGRHSMTASINGEISPCAKILAIDNRRLLGKLGDVVFGLTHIRNRADLVTCRSLKKNCEAEGIGGSYLGGCFAVNHTDTSNLFAPSLQEHHFSILRQAVCSGCGSQQ